MFGPWVPACAGTNAEIIRVLANPSSLIKQPSRHSDTSPGLVRAPGSARILLPFLLPQCEGVARQGRRAHGYPWAARVLPGDLAQEVDASLRGCVGDTLTRHAASLRLRVHGGRTKPGSHPGRFARRPPAVRGLALT